MSRPLRIAIDGPSGSGKSTLGKALAQRLGLPYVDTGAMYRAVAWAMREAGLRRADEIVARLQTLRLEIRPRPEAFRVLVDGRDVTEHLRTPTVSRAAAEVAAIEGVRRWMVPQQQRAARDGGVLEGRDIGTVVLPDADYKFFVTSDESTRMARRAAQLGVVQGDEKAAREDVRERDKMDRSRRVSPLVAAEDAVLIDTSSQTVAQSLAAMLDAMGIDRD
jgi:cytidylate kinase